jgi:hypothetical protein
MPHLTQARPLLLKYQYEQSNNKNNSDAINPKHSSNANSNKIPPASRASASGAQMIVLPEVTPPPERSSIPHLCFESHEQHVLITAAGILLVVDGIA